MLKFLKYLLKKGGGNAFIYFDHIYPEYPYPYKVGVIGYEVDTDLNTSFENFLQIYSQRNNIS